MKFTLSDEHTSQSPHSPGIVKNTEQLVRVAYAPSEVVNGKLISAAINTNDLKERGVSVFRDKYVEEKHISELATSQMQRRPKDRAAAYVSIFDVNDVRKCTISVSVNNSPPVNKRSFVVIDEARIDIISHATIFSVSTKNRAKIKQLKNQLVDILNKNTSINL